MKWDLWTEGADGEDYCESIYQLSQYFLPQQGLEIGVRFGKSALATLLGSPKMKLVGVDPNPEFPVEEFMKKQVGNRFRFIPLASPEALEGFHDGIFDWIYIDGLHDYQGVLNDFEASWRLLKPGGVMVFDDYDDTLDYVTEVKRALIENVPRVTGKPFMHISTEDYGLHPNPHKAAILIKDNVN